MDQSAPNEDEIVVDLDESAMPLDGAINKHATMEIPDGAEYALSDKVAAESQINHDQAKDSGMFGKKNTRK